MLDSRQAPAAAEDLPAFVAGLITRGATPQHALDVATSCLLSAIGVDMCTVLTPLSDDEFLVRAASGLSRHDAGHARLPGGHGSATSFAAQQYQAVVFDNLHKTARFASSYLPARYGVTSMVAVSVRVADKTVGVLGVHSRTPRQFASHDIRLLERMAPVVAQILAGEHPRD